ncbi:MAG: hypothetical protein ACJ79J_07115, partial [Gemmatimonadaceae bacterium]
HGFVENRLHRRAQRFPILNAVAERRRHSVIGKNDQVGAHGSAGGDQVYPFLISPERLGLAGEVLEDARDIHRTILARYAAANAENAPPSAARLTPMANQAVVRSI